VKSRVYIVIVPRSGLFSGRRNAEVLLEFFEWCKTKQSQSVRSFMAVFFVSNDARAKVVFEDASGMRRSRGRI
jgi:hypothetical protein